MNKKRWSIAILVVVAAGVVTFEATTNVLRGWWRGEAFYHGRPTSYWSEEMRQWRLLLET